MTQESSGEEPPQGPVEFPAEQDNDSLDMILVRDFLLAGRRVGRNPSEARAWIRSIFAAMEGLVSVLQSQILTTPGFELAPEERALLKCERFSLKNSGEVHKGRDKQTFKQRLKFTVRIVKRMHPDYEIDYKDTGWKALLDSLEVRHRLTHPTRREHMKVTDRELGAAVEGLGWFFSKVVGPGQHAITRYLTNPKARNALLVAALRGELPDKGGE